MVSSTIFVYFLSAQILKTSQPTQPTNPHCFIYYVLRSTWEEVMLRGNKFLATQYLVWLMVLPKLMSYVQNPLILYQSLPARKIVSYVLFSFTYHIPVHTAVFTLFITHIPQRRRGIFFQADNSKQSWNTHTTYDAMFQSIKEIQS